MTKEVRCPCGASARDVSKFVIDSSRPLTLERIWYCPTCETYAPMDRDKRPQGVLASEATWKQREKVRALIKAIGCPLTELGRRFGLPPWNTNIDTFADDLCQEIIDELSEPIKRPRRTKAQIKSDKRKADEEALLG
jgi:hypothetical protein